MSLGQAFSSVFKGTLYRGVSTVGSRVFDFLTLAVLTRHILLEGYGAWSLSWETAGLLFTVYHLLSFGEVVVSYISKYKAQGRPNYVRRVFFYSLVWNLTLSATFFMLAFFSSDFFAQSYNSPQMSFLIRLVALTFVIESVSGPCMRFLNAYKEFGSLALLDLLGSFLKLCFVSLFLFLGGGAEGAALGHVVYVTISTCLFGLLAMKRLPQSSPGEEYKFTTAIKEMLTFTVPLAASSTITTLRGQFLIVYLGWWATLESIGLYRAAEKSVKLITVVILLITSPLLPVISEMYAKNRIKDIKRLVATILKHLTPLVALICAIVVVGAPEIVTLIYGTDFGPAAVYLQWRIPVIIVILIKNITTTIMLGAGKTSFILKMNLVITSVYFPIQLLMVRYYEAMGLNISTVIFNFVLTVPISLYYLWKEIGRMKVGLDSIKRFIYSLMPPFAFILLIHFIDLNGIIFLSLTLISIPTYLLTACIVGYFKKEEVEKVQSIVQRGGKERLYLSPIFNVLYKLFRE